MKTVKLILGLVLALTVHVGVFSTVAWAHAGHSHSELIHLSFVQGQVHAHITWVEGPEVALESVLRVEWKRASDHADVEPQGDFEVVLWMPSMDHGSAPTKIEPVLDEDGNALVGVYEVSRVYFTMGGDWQVNVIVNYEDGTSETQSFDVNLPGGHGGHGHSHGHSHHH